MGMWLVIHVSFSRTDAVGVGKRFVFENGDVLSSLGQQRDVSLGFGGFDLSTRGPSGHSSFTLVVRGEKDEAAVDMELLKISGIWCVYDANAKFGNGDLRRLQGDCPDSAKVWAK